MRKAADRTLPPVHLWQPESIGRIDIEIRNDGTWLHDGRPIERTALVDLFATILRVEEGVYYLVTPVEKLRISVADVPFIATDVDTRGTGESLEVLVTTNVGDHVLADAEHPIFLSHDKPYIEIRDGLRARFTQSAYYRLTQKVVEEGGRYVLFSAGCRFELG